MTPEGYALTLERASGVSTDCPLVPSTTHATLNGVPFVMQSRGRVVGLKGGYACGGPLFLLDASKVPTGDGSARIVISDGSGTIESVLPGLLTPRTLSLLTEELTLQAGQEVLVHYTPEFDMVSGRPRIELRDRNGRLAQEDSIEVRHTGGMTFRFKLPPLDAGDYLMKMADVGSVTARSCTGVRRCMASLPETQPLPVHVALAD
jgi:hypothetical protein